MAFGLGWGVVVFGALFLVVVAIAFLWGTISDFGAELIVELREANGRGIADVLFVLFVGTSMTVGALLLVYAGIGWLSGDRDSLMTALESTLGIIFLFVLLGCLLFGLILLIKKILYWVNGNPEEARGRAFTILIWVVLSPLAFVLLPVTGWRKSKAENEGLVMQIWSAIVAFIIGISISAGSVAAYIGLVYAIIN